MSSKVWASCKCYYQKCLYSKTLGCDVDFVDKESFLKKYTLHLEEVEQQEEVVREVVEEVERRRSRGEVTLRNREVVRGSYTPLHKELFEDTGQVSSHREVKSVGKEKVTKSEFPAVDPEDEGGGDRRRPLHPPPAHPRGLCQGGGGAG